MKKLFTTIIVLALQFVCVANAKVISNEKINDAKVKTASKIITELQQDMPSFTKNGSGNLKKEELLYMEILNPNSGNSSYMNT